MGTQILSYMTVARCLFSQKSLNRVALYTLSSLENRKSFKMGEKVEKGMHPSCHGTNGRVSCKPLVH
jgi:hypothetical protein